jgi:DNA-binding FadR family transcriptional regulator
MLEAAIRGAPLWLSPFRQPAATAGGKGATRVALQIEEEILADGWRCGALFGSVKSLEDRYGIGRSVAREAVRILEIRGEGRLRRGPKGGLMIARPDLARTSLSLVNQLLNASATIGDLVAARRALDRELIVLAGRVPIPRPSPECDPTARVRAHFDLRLEMAQRLGNPALALFVRSLNDFSIGLLQLAPDVAKVVSAVDRFSTLARADPSGTTLLSAMEAVDARLLGDHHATTSLGSLLAAADIDASPTAPSRPVEIARIVAADILAGRWRAGERIGSETDLCEHFEVSRMTLRQAVRLLEEFGIAETQAGRGNGLFACARESEAAIIRMAHGYLASRHWAGDDWWLAARPIQAALIEAAERNLPSDHRRRYRAMIAEVRAETRLRRMMNGQAEIIRDIAGHADSAILRLFSDIAMSYRHRVLTEAVPERRDVCRRLATQADAYLDGFLAMRPQAHRDIYHLMSIPIETHDSDWVTRLAFRTLAA